MLNVRNLYVLPLYGQMGQVGQVQASLGQVKETYKQKGSKLDTSKKPIRPSLRANIAMGKPS